MQRFFLAVTSIAHQPDSIPANKFRVILIGSMFGLLAGWLAGRWLAYDITHNVMMERIHFYFLVEVHNTLTQAPRARPCTISRCQVVESNELRRTASPLSPISRPWYRSDDGHARSLCVHIRSHTIRSAVRLIVATLLLLLLLLSSMSVVVYASDIEMWRTNIFHNYFRISALIFCKFSRKTRHRARKTRLNASCGTQLTRRD